MQADYAHFARDCSTQLSQGEREQILALAEDLPALWHADSTTPEDRQTVARLLLEQVTVTIEGNTDRLDVELRWATVGYAELDLGGVGAIATRSTPT